LQNQSFNWACNAKPRQAPPRFAGQYGKKAAKTDVHAQAPLARDFDFPQILESRESSTRQVMEVVAESAPSDRIARLAGRAFDAPQYFNAGDSLVVTNVFRNWSADRTRHVTMTVNFTY